VVQNFTLAAISSGGVTLCSERLPKWTWTLLAHAALLRPYASRASLDPNNIVEIGWPQRHSI
jgi:hypothetical protein